MACDVERVTTLDRLAKALASGGYVEVYMPKEIDAETKKILQQLASLDWKPAPFDKSNPPKIYSVAPNAIPEEIKTFFASRNFKYEDVEFSYTLSREKNWLNRKPKH